MADAATAQAGKLRFLEPGLPQQVIHVQYWIKDTSSTLADNHSSKSNIGIKLK